MDLKLQKLAGLGRTVLLVSGLGLAVVGILTVVASNDPMNRLLAVLVFASGVIVVLLGMMVTRMGVFKQILRHVQYLTQSSEYTSRLVHEITEVMKAIEEAEAEEREQKKREKAQVQKTEAKEDLEIEKAVRQFEK